MKKLQQLIFCTFCCILFWSNQKINAQNCQSNQTELKITIVPDDYVFQENQWKLLNANNGEVLQSGVAEGGVFCLDTAGCYTFEMTDSYGDGLSEGHLYVYLNGELKIDVANFGYLTELPFGNCQTGSSCNFPEPITLGQNYTTFLPDTWYTFTADTTGKYKFTTCNLGNTCTKPAIWIYDHCQGVQISDKQEGTIAYGATGCDSDPNAAQCIAQLQKGKTYIIRIGDIQNYCAGIPIIWQASFEGAISGCTALGSCNYNPLAAIDDGSCLEQGNPNCPQAPDLMVVQPDIENSLYIQKQDNTDACIIAEGCMAGYGTRYLLRFTTHIKNIGDQDYFIGQTPDVFQSNDQFEWDPCHNHHHYRGYAEYLLFDEQNNKIPIGFKNGFCVMDLECEDGGDMKYSCGNQGISYNCGDIYDSQLDCQWIDVTNVPTGDYTLVVRVNWDNSPDKLGRIEKNIHNNWAQVCIHIQNENDNVSFELLQPCEPYVDCLGEIYGSATPDCAGICAGNALAGDLNNSGNYTPDDLIAYLDAVIGNAPPISNCNDLNNDDVISIADPVVLNACMLQTLGTHQHTGGGNPHNHCTFPTNTALNINDTVTFEISNYNTSQNYIDINLYNPTVKVLAYQLQVSGLHVIGATHLLTNQQGYAADLFFNETGTIATISIIESPIERAIVNNPQPILRIYYDQITEPFICIKNVTETLNDNYEKIVGLITGSCLEKQVVTNTTQLTTPPNNTLTAQIIPNPMHQSAVLKLANAQPNAPKNQPFNFSILDITTGKIIKNYGTITGNSFEIKRTPDLPAGLYLYKVIQNNQTAIGKLVIN